MSDDDARVRVTEIFPSIQGESTRAGLPSVFVRLTGCPLRCRWCDTRYAFSGGMPLTVAECVARVHAHDVGSVCVTGGEPLAQPGCLPLLAALCDAGFSVSLETSGAMDISRVDPRVSRIMDLKAPGSGEAHRNRWENLECLKRGDEIKIVLEGEADYRWARETIERHRLAQRCEVLLSPVHGALPLRTLAEWILRDRLPVRLQVQLHKLIWGEVRGR